MIYEFSDREKKNERVEKEHLLLREEYQKPEMSKEQFEKLRMKMEEAKMMDKKEFKKAGMNKLAVTAAAVAAAFLIREGENLENSKAFKVE